MTKWISLFDQRAAQRLTEWEHEQQGEKRRNKTIHTHTVAGETWLWDEEVEEAATRGQ